MKFTVGTVSNSINFEEDIKLIKSALLYADEIELIGMLEYTIFKYLPERVDSIKDFRALTDSFIPVLKSVDDETSKELINQLEDLKGRTESYDLLFRKKKHLSKNELIAKIKYEQTLKEGKNILQQGLASMTEVPSSREVKELIKRGIISVCDYDLRKYDLDSLAGGYFGNLMGIMQNNTAFPLFDKTSSDLIASLNQSHIIDLGNVNHEVLVHAGLATNILMTLPTLESATIDEILDFKKEMEGPLHLFQGAIFDFSEEVESMPWDDDFKYDCLKLYHKEVLPKIEELNELSSDTSVLKNMGRKVLADEEFRKKAAWTVGGLATTITTNSDMIAAVNSLKIWITGLSLIVVAPNAVSAFLKAISIQNESKQEVKEVERKMKGNTMYYYYKATREL